LAVFGKRYQHADASNILLRARSERPRCRCAAKQRDELAPFQLTKSHRLP
jgi:hypothetical protein